jgi:hypothetical protein
VGADVAGEGISGDVGAFAVVGRDGGVTPGERSALGVILTGAATAGVVVGVRMCQVGGSVALEAITGRAVFVSTVIVGCAGPMTTGAASQAVAGSVTPAG